MKVEILAAFIAASGAFAAKPPGYGSKSHYHKSHTKAAAGGSKSHHHHKGFMATPSVPSSKNHHHHHHKSAVSPVMASSSPARHSHHHHSKATMTASPVVTGHHHHLHSGGKISTTTITQNTCTTMPEETLITVTNGVTVTYCPKCEGMSMPGFTTIYTTTYESLCPTGMVPETYTVTESCTEPKPTWVPGRGHIPQGFTVTTKMCTVCGEMPTPVTITEPCGCEAHEGTPGPPGPPAPTPPSPPPSQCNGEECGESISGNGPGGSPPACNGEECGESINGSGPTPGSSTTTGQGAPPYPTPSTAHRNLPTGSLPSGVAPIPPTGHMPITPPTNAASSLSLNSVAILSSSFAAVVVGALAFAL